MTDGEIEALARIAASLLDAPIATISLIEERVTRLGASGVSWPLADEEPVLRWIAAADAGNASPLSVFELGPTVPASELVADGILSLCAVPIRDDGNLLGILAIYARAPLAPSHLVRRSLIDLGAVAAKLVLGRRASSQRASTERAVRIATALGELVRSTDWRAVFPIAIDTLGATRASEWGIDGASLVELGTWDRERRFTPVKRPLASPAVLGAIGEAEVIPVSDARCDPRTRELAAYLDEAGIASQLIVPVVLRGHALAAISFEYADERRWSLDEIRFATAIGGWLAPLLAPAHGGSSGPTHAEQRILTFVDNSRDLIVITDVHGRITYTNRALAHRLRQAPTDLLGRSIGEFNPPELRDLPGFTRLRATGHEPALEQTFTRVFQFPGGETRELEVAATVFAVEGTTYAGCIARDVSATTKRLDATMATAAIAIAHVSLDGQFLRFNDELRVLVGRRREELRAYQQAVDLAPPPDARGLAFADAMGLVGRIDLGAVRGELVTSHRPYELEYELVRPDGTHAWVDLSIALVRDVSDRPAYFVVVAREITARRRADMALRGLAQTLSTTAPTLYARASEFISTTFGARCVLIGKLDGATLVPIAAWRDGAPFDAPPRDLVGTPFESVRRTGVCYYPERLQELFPDDRVLADLGATSYLGAPLRDDDGRTIGVLAVFGDRPFDPALSAEDVVQLCATRIATELQRLDAIDVLGAREEQLRQITESAHETFWLSEWPSRHLLYVSPAFAALTGRSVASVYANRATWGSGLHPDDRPRVDAAMRDLERAPVDLTARVIRADGQLRWIKIRAALVHNREGRPYRVAGSFEDITHIVEVQRALEERERQLGEALASSEREVEQLQQRLGEHDQLHGMVGGSQLLRTAYRRLRQAAQGDVTVLIAGESGTGKELAANALHAMSSRQAKPFVAINCAAIPEPLLESELFGHVKGAFTGASRDKVGLMQAAEGGTLFLDEIGDMSPVLQAKLLRALEERCIRRVGDEKAVPIDIRLVSASHRDLRGLVASGRMREDFYYRIKVFEIEMPPLRDRREDIPALANHFAAELGQAAGKPNLAISADALRALLSHRWPGNVRELRNAIEHALVTVSGSTIHPADLPIEVRTSSTDARPAEAVAATPPPLGGTMRDQIEEALRRTGGNRAEAARLLGIGRVTLWKRMRRLGMTTAAEQPPGDEA